MAARLNPDEDLEAVEPKHRLGDSVCFFKCGKCDGREKAFRAKKFFLAEEEVFFRHTRSLFQPVRES